VSRRPSFVTATHLHNASEYRRREACPRNVSNLAPACTFRLIRHAGIQHFAQLVVPVGHSSYPVSYLTRTNSTPTRKTRHYWRPQDPLSLAAARVPPTVVVEVGLRDFSRHSRRAVGTGAAINGAATHQTQLQQLANPGCQWSPDAPRSPRRCRFRDPHHGFRRPPETFPKEISTRKTGKPRSVAGVRELPF
jgi:hypothetical protein